MKIISSRTFVVGALGVAFLLAGVVSFYASGHPDGLEYVAGKSGFLGTATEHATAAVSPFADYAIDGIGNARLSGGVAGIVGCVVVLLLATGLHRLVTAGARDDAAQSDA